MIPYFDHTDLLGWAAQHGLFESVHPPLRPGASTAKAAPSGRRFRTVEIPTR